MISKLAVTAVVALAAGTVLAGAGSASAAEARPAGVVRLGGVSMQGACNNQYPGEGRRSIALNPQDAGSWRCKRVVTAPRPGAPVYVYYGWINVTAECRVILQPLGLTQ